jgi:hypothetical protein
MIRRGKRLQVVQGEKQIDGRCLGIATDGAMMLEIDGNSGVLTCVKEL